MASGVYNKFLAALLSGDIDLDTAQDTLKMQLHTSSYTPDADHGTLGDLTNQLATGSGYTSNGITVLTQSVTQDDTNDRAYLDSADIEWTSTNVTARYGILIDVTASNTPMCWYDFGSDKTSTNNFKLTVNVGGLLRNRLAD